MKPSGLVRKLQKMAAMGRKTFSSMVAKKGYFVVCITDQKRFEIPLLFLNNISFLELLRMSEEEYGPSSDGPIQLPCDSELMNKIVSLIQHGESKVLTEL